MKRDDKENRPGVELPGDRSYLQQPNSITGSGSRSTAAGRLKAMIENDRDLLERGIPLSLSEVYDFAGQHVKVPLILISKYGALAAALWGLARFRSNRFTGMSEPTTVLADYFKISPRTVRRALQVLVDAGELEAIERPGNSTVYRAVKMERGDPFDGLEVGLDTVEDELPGSPKQDLSTPDKKDRGHASTPDKKVPDPGQKGETQRKKEDNNKKESDDEIREDHPLNDVICRMEDELLEIGVSKRVASRILTRYEEGELPGLGQWIGWIIHKKRSPGYLVDGLKAPDLWYQNTIKKDPVPLDPDSPASRQRYVEGEFANFWDDD